MLQFEPRAGHDPKRRLCVACGSWLKDCFNLWSVASTASLGTEYSVGTRRFTLFQSITLQSARRTRCGDSEAPAHPRSVALKAPRKPRAVIDPTICSPHARRPSLPTSHSLHADRLIWRNLRLGVRLLARRSWSILVLMVTEGCPSVLCRSAVQQLPWSRRTAASSHTAGA